MGPLPVTVGTDQVAFGHLRQERFQGNPNRPCCIGDGEQLFLPISVVEIHHIIGMAFPTIRTRLSVLGISDMGFQSPVVFLGLFKIPALVLSVVFSPGRTETIPAPTLRFAAAPQGKTNSRQVLLTPRTPERGCVVHRAGDGTRTHNKRLGKPRLCQLSYTRTVLSVSGQSRIRTCVGVIRQIYSLVPLAARPSARKSNSLSIQLFQELAKGLEPLTC